MPVQAIIWSAHQPSLISFYADFAGVNEPLRRLAGHPDSCYGWIAGATAWIERVLGPQITNRGKRKPT
ncbi:MAG: hypothetical protein ACYTF1_16400 [Planctomycetota bacterium]